MPAAFRGADSVLLKNSATGLCADLPGYGDGTTDGPVNQYYCQPGSSDNQVWTLQVTTGPRGPGDASLFTIRNNRDNLCMDLPDFGAKPAGTKVNEFSCAPTTSDNQLWYLAEGKDNHFRIRNYASHGLCLGVSGGTGAGPDAQLQIEECGSTTQDWSRPSGK